MNYRFKLYINIMFIILCLSYVYEPLWGQRVKSNEQGLPTIKVAFSEDQSIAIERVLYTALKRSGYQMISKATGIRTAAADVNYGDAAILPVQTDGWEKMYPNLIKVPVAIDHVEYSVYARLDESYQFSRWENLAGLSVGYQWQNEHITNNIGRIRTGKLVRVNDFDELWASLISGETDVVVLPRLTHFEHRYPNGVKRAGVAERLPVYSYVNNRYDYLVPLLEKAYKEIIEDGTLELIFSGREAAAKLLPIQEKPIILHLNSYNAQNEWERSQMESIRGSLGTKTALEYYSINLNSNEPHSQVSFNLIISEMIRTEFVSRYPDLIIASGNEAYNFVLDNYHLLFSKVPILFFGVHKFNDPLLYGLEDNITGVFEEISFFETVSQMLKSFPETRRIFVLNDHYLSRSIGLNDSIQKELHRLPVDVVFNEDKPLPEVLDDIRGLGSKTLVLIGNYLSDSEGTFYSEIEIQKLVSHASINPVYCLTTSFIGHGTLGGLVSSTEDKSNIVASMAAAILNGAAVKDIPVIFDSAFLNQWQFDYKTVKRFNVNLKTLPKGRVMINRVLPIWESNPTEFRLLVTVAVLLLLIVCGLIVFFIRNRKMTQRLALAAEEARNANKAKSSFLAKMSHEIRTPMNAILGITEIQLRDENLSSDTEEAVRKIYESGDVLLNIVNDILDLSKIEAGKLELVPVKYDIPSLINDSVQLNRLRYDSKPIDLSINLDESTPHYLFGDELRIKQVLNNILSNAFKYTDEGGVTLNVTYEPDGDDDENVIIIFRICDTGQGMNNEQIKDLFDEYTRFNTEANRDTVGTGLGMSITKHLLDLMKGEIIVNSEQGKGTEFVVRLPQKRVGSEICGSDIAVKLHNFNFRSTTLTNKTQFLREYMPYGNVLVVDDVESNIYVVKGMLLPYGISVDVAYSGFEAIDKVKEGKVYDIVFMDHMMPKMDGIETTKNMRLLGYKHNIVALTANALIGRAEMFMRNGFDGFISKPIDSRELNLMLNDLIRNKKPPEVVEAARQEISKRKGSSSESAQKTAISDELITAAVHDIENVLDVLGELLPLLDSGKADLGLYATTVHGMKSALANIGEIKLSHVALRLEHAAQNREISVLAAETTEFMHTLQALLGKYKRPETDNNDGPYALEVSNEDMDFLRNKLNEIKTACENLIIKDAKTALNELKQKKWPRKISDAIDEISLFLIRGEYSKAADAAADAVNM